MFSSAVSNHELLRYRLDSFDHSANLPPSLVSSSRRIAQVLVLINMIRLSQMRLVVLSLDCFRNADVPNVIASGAFFLGLYYSPLFCIWNCRRRLDIRQPTLVIVISIWKDLDSVHDDVVG